MAMKISTETQTTRKQNEKKEENNGTHAHTYFTVVVLCLSKI